MFIKKNERELHSPVVPVVVEIRDRRRIIPSVEVVQQGGEAEGGVGIHEIRRRPGRPDDHGQRSPCVRRP